MVRTSIPFQEIDHFIEGRIYLSRIARGLTRQKLAKVIGVSHQQLQKYEKGINRIAVSRIVLIAKVLDKPIDYFYQGIEIENPALLLTQHQRICLEVSKNFMKIRNPIQQTAINVLVKSLLKKPA